MRLIDADALKEQTQFRLPVNNPIAEIYADCVRIHRKNIDEAPTIDAEPVRHGHWEYVKPEKDGVYGSCSICGYEATTTFHCPNCGAKMDEEDNT